MIILSSSNQVTLVKSREMHWTQLIQILGELAPKYFISIKSQSHPLASTVCSFQTGELARILHS